MSRRPQPTLADYVVTALSPALIMLLVGSLVFFLIEVFYQGSYDGRLTFIMAMFVMAAVLIARISIEQSREYAMLFAIPLAIVTAIATFRFVEFRGPLQSFSHFINLGLIALIWWCADRLTWDSTVIDESKDASGEGLLQTAGLDDQATTQNASSREAAGPQQPQQTLWQRFLSHRRRTHSPGLWVIYFSLAALPIFGFGNWFVPGENLEAKRYVFKLLVGYVGSALGLLLTTSFLNLRRYLRQRRLEMPVDMAGTWIGTGAAMIVALLLVCALLPRRNPEYSITQLPIFAGSPTDLWTTEYAVGNEGQEDPEKGDRPGDQPPDPNSPSGGDQPAPGDPSPDGPSKSDSGGGQQPPPKGNSRDQSGTESGGDQGNQSGEQKGGKQGGQQGEQQGGQQGGKSEGESKGQTGSDNKTQPTGQPKGSSGGKTGDDKQPPGPSEKSPQSPDSDSQSQPSGEQKGKNKSNEKDGGKKPGDSPTKPRQQSNPKENSGQGNDDRQEPRSQNKSDERQRNGEPQEPPQKNQTSNPSQPKSTSKFDPSKIASALGGTIGQLLKLLYWVVALAIIGYFTWKYWRQIREAVANFMKSLREFWESLFGRKPTAALEESPLIEAAPPPVPFASFHDPFLTGMAESKPAVEVIRYSFAALEAWAREFGCGRTPEQTPHEFVQVMGAHQVPVARDAALLAEMYNRCAFARDAGQRINIEPLRKLWQQMRESVGA